MLLYFVIYVIIFFEQCHLYQLIFLIESNNKPSGSDGEKYAITCPCSVYGFRPAHRKQKQKNSTLKKGKKR